MAEGRVAICSCFRDMAKRLHSYFDRVNRYRALLEACNWECRLIAGEGDSKDDTRRELIRRANENNWEIDIVDVSHGFPHFGSIVSKDRFRELSKIGNTLLSRVNEDDNIVFYVESDLIWKPETILRLGSRVLDVESVDVVAPMPFAGSAFYDIWAFRGLNNEHFGPFAPYHSQLQQERLNEVRSVGSCLVMKAEVARNCQMIDDHCLVGFCDDARGKGYRIWVDPRERVNHP